MKALREVATDKGYLSNHTMKTLKQDKVRNYVSEPDRGLGNRNVKRWNNSSQRYRWMATALSDIEPRFRRIKGYRFLPALRLALRNHLRLDHDTHNAFAAD